MKRKWHNIFAENMEIRLKLSKRLENKHMTFTLVSVISFKNLLDYKKNHTSNTTNIRTLFSWIRRKINGSKYEYIMEKKYTRAACRL